MFINLIQRCKFVDNFDPEGGVNRNVNLHYMGSAEFEFGALPKSLREVCFNLDNYESLVLDSIKNPKGESLYLFIDQARFSEEVVEFLFKKSNSETEGGHTKESVRLADAVNGKIHKFNQVDLWWDIENHFFFTFGLENVDKLKTILHNVRPKMTA